MSDRLAELEARIKIYKEILNTMRSDTTDVDLVSYSGKWCIVMQTYGGYVIQKSGTQAWIPFTTMEEIVDYIIRNP